MNHIQKAEHFVNDETQFQLGFLPTEQSNPKTENLSQVIAGDMLAGIDMLLSVDADIPPAASRVLNSEQFDGLVSTMTDFHRNHGTNGTRIR